MANTPQDPTNLYAPPKAAVEDVGVVQSIESLGRFTAWGGVRSHAGDIWHLRGVLDVYPYAKA